MKVLIVGDNETAVVAMKHALGDAGYETIVASGDAESEEKS